MSLTKIGPSLLHMEDVAEYLNTVLGFVTDKDNATDVSSVAGEPAEQIVVAYSKEDRTTVRNSMHLEGHPASYYMTAKKGELVDEITKTIRANTSAELSELRDEVYQLRSELSKLGVLEKYVPYSGYYDNFITGKNQFVEDAVGIAIADSTDQFSIVLSDEAYAGLEIGEHIMLKLLDTGAHIVTKVAEKLPDEQTVRFSDGVGYNIIRGEAEIYKTWGNNVNGYFFFGEVTPEKPGTREFYNCLDDDTFPMRRAITASNTGFGYTFRIPAARQGNYLSRFDIEVKKFGTPGNLMCYIIDERNVENFQNASQAETDGLILAKSQPLFVDASKGEHIASFSFYDGRTFPLLEEKDTVDHKIRYCAIVEALEADDENRYEIVFLRHKDSEGEYGDLQLNNITYWFTSQPDIGSSAALETDATINATDMFYGVGLIEAVSETFTPYDSGIYTAKFKTSHAGTKLRLCMRIAREGMFYVDKESTATGALLDNSTIVVTGETNDDVHGFDSSPHGTIIVGTTARSVTHVNNNHLTVSKGLYIEDGDPVYPMNYKITIKAKDIEWDEESCAFQTKDTAYQELSLVAVLPDEVHKNRTDSDRLIFETEFRDEEGNARIMNDFELQIAWEKSAKAVSSNIAGKIMSLDVTVDRSY